MSQNTFILCVWHKIDKTQIRQNDFVPFFLRSSDKDGFGLFDLLSGFRLYFVASLCSFFLILPKFKENQHLQSFYSEKDY